MAEVKIRTSPLGSYKLYMTYALSLNSNTNLQGLFSFACYITSNKPAAPIPPPTHIVDTTYLAPLLLPSIRA